jgi:phytoene dehydrogenase-like protein
MLRSSYDVVIVGTDLPALVFGALAAKKGYRVLVLGHGGKDNVYEIEGHRCVRRPNLMWGFAESAPIREVFRELALAPEMRNLPRPLQPTCNVVLPDARIEISHMKGILEDEVAREFPGKLEAFRDFTRSMADAEPSLEALLRDTPVLPPGTIREYFAYRRYRKDVSRFLPDAEGDADALAPFTGDPRMLAFFTAPLAAMSGVTDPRAHPLAFIRLASHLLRGLSFVEWGMDALKALFLDRIRNNSGDVRPTDHVDMLIARRGGLREVEVRARDESIGAGVVVAGTALGPLLDAVSEGGRKRRFHQRVERVLPSHWLVTLNVGARRAALPEGMAQTAFVVADPSKPLEGTNWLAIQTDPAMEPPESLDPERTTIAVCGRMPAARFHGKPGDIEAFTHELLDGLRRFMPFIDPHVSTLSTAAIGTNPRTGDPIVDATGMVPLYPDTVVRSLDLVTWPCRTAYDNVLFLGDAACGALGFEGASLAAYMAFDVLKRKIQLKSTVGG